MTTGVEAGIARAVVSATRFIVPTIAEKQRRKKLADEVKPLLAAHNADILMNEIGSKNAKPLLSFFESPEFERIALTLTVSVYNGSKEPELSQVREELRLGLARHINEESERLFEITEVTFNILLASANMVQATLRTPVGGHASPALLATTAQLVAASSRNCDILSRTKETAAFEDFCTALRGQAKAAYATMKLPHAGLNRAVSYSRIFVQPDIYRFQLRENQKASQDQARTTVSKLISTKLRFVLLGDPGAGKSTSANKLAFDIATNKIPSLVNRVPFLVQLRDHTEKLKGSADATLIDCIKASCNRPHHIFPSTEQIEHALLGGRAVLIIDGVDELGEPSLRARLADLVEGFAVRYPLTQIMVTSRQVGYFDAPLNEEAFPIYRVAPFSENQVISYSNKWFQAGSGAYQLSASEMSKAFVQESQTTVPDLRTNPLLLSLLCGMYASTQYLPRNRPEVYEKCAEMLFERWDRSRGVHVPLRFAADIRPAVQQLAWLLLTDQKSRVALPRSEILRFLTDYLKSKRYEDEDEATQAATDFVDFCAGRAWALSEVGSSLAEPLYGFTHRTFLEYFAASRIVRHAPDARMIWSLIGDKILDSSWREVAHLSMQILDRTVEDQANLFLELILDTLPSEHEYERGQYLAFCVNSLSAIHPSPATFRRLVNSTVQMASARTVQERCPVITQPIYLGSMFGGDDALIMLLMNRHEYREKACRLAIEEMLSLSKTSPWYENAASLLIASLLPGHPFSDVTIPELSGKEAIGASLPWHQLFDAVCPPDVEKLTARHFLGRPLFFSRITSSPLEKVIELGLQDELNSSTRRLAKQMENTLISTPNPWETVVYSATPSRNSLRERTLLLPPSTIIKNSKRTDSIALSSMEESGLVAIPEECRGLAILGALPMVEIYSDAPDSTEDDWLSLNSSFYMKLLRARSVGLARDRDYARSALKRLKLQPRVEEFIEGWIEHRVSVLSLQLIHPSEKLRLVSP